jgi:hypothetical protein
MRGMAGMRIMTAGGKPNFIPMICTEREEHEKPWVPGDLFSGIFF